MTFPCPWRGFLVENGSCDGKKATLSVDKEVLGDYYYYSTYLSFITRSLHSLIPWNSNCHNPLTKLI
jgi:hypothetical protein